MAVLCPPSKPQYRVQLHGKLFDSENAWVPHCAAEEVVERHANLKPGQSVDVLVFALNDDAATGLYGLKSGENFMRFRVNYKLVPNFAARPI